MAHPKFSSPESPAAARLLSKIASCVREVIQDDASTDAQEMLRENMSIGRIARGENHNVATLAGVVDALGYEVVFQLREKPRQVSVAS